MHEGNGIMGDGGERSALERMSERVRDYLSSRSADHWIMFLAGVIVGLIVG